LSVKTGNFLDTGVAAFSASTERTFERRPLPPLASHVCHH